MMTALGENRNNGLVTRERVTLLELRMCAILAEKSMIMPTRNSMFIPGGIT